MFKITLLQQVNDINEYIFKDAIGYSSRRVYGTGIWSNMTEIWLTLYKCQQYIWCWVMLLSGSLMSVVIWTTRVSTYHKKPYKAKQGADIPQDDLTDALKDAVKSSTAARQLWYQTEMHPSGLKDKAFGSQRSPCSSLPQEMPHSRLQVAPPPSRSQELLATSAAATSSTVTRCLSPSEQIS